MNKPSVLLPFRFAKILLSVLALLLVSCGGGDDDSDQNDGLGSVGNNAKHEFRLVDQFNPQEKTFVRHLIARSGIVQNKNPQLYQLIDQFFSPPRHDVYDTVPVSGSILETSVTSSGEITSISEINLPQFPPNLPATDVLSVQAVVLQDGTFYEQPTPIRVFSPTTLKLTFPLKVQSSEPLSGVASVVSIVAITDYGRHFSIYIASQSI